MKIGILSGIHEDIIRLEEALTILKERNCDTLLCLGDIVGYSVPYYGYFKSRNAHKAVQSIKSNCKYAVAGNHDIFAVNKTPQISVFKYPNDWSMLSYFEKAKISNGEVWVYGDELPALLEPEDEKYLQGLPEYMVQSFGDLKVMFSHYVKPNLVGDHTKLDASKNSMEKHFDFMKQESCQISIFSHDLQNGVRIFHKDSIKILPFGKHELKDFPIALNGPWVANGTEANGVMVLDTEVLSVEVIPLNTPPHKVPEWFDK
jgi:predicted phosphodiesterase